MPQGRFHPAPSYSRPRPSSSFASTAALASRSLWTTESWPSQAAKCNGVEPREPRKIEVLEIVATETPPELNQHCSFEMPWTHPVGWNACCIWYPLLFEAMSAMLPVKMTSIPWTCFFTPGVACKRPNMAELAHDMEKRGFERCLQNGKCHSHISKSNLKDVFFSKANGVGENNIYSDKEQSQILVQMIWYNFKKMWKSKYHKNITITSTSSWQSHAFPPILVRGHGRICPAHPQPPWPRGGVGHPRRGHWKLRSATVSSLGSHGPRPSPRQHRRVWKRKLGPERSKYWNSIGNCGHSNSPWAQPTL